MNRIVEALERLFHFASKVSSRTARGLLQHGAGQYAVKAMRQVDFTIKGVRISYHHLSDYDKQMADELSQYAVRFAAQYADHHDKYVDFRMRHHDIQDIIDSHADEIYNAAIAAYSSRLRSHGYDAIAGKANRVSVFQDEDFTKQFIIALITEVADHFYDNSD